MGSSTTNRRRMIRFVTGLCVMGLALQTHAATPVVSDSVREHAPASDPTDSGGWILNQSISDEFSAEKIDPAKWHIQGMKDHYENNFKGRAPSQFVPDNVSVSDGHLRIATKWQPSFRFVQESMGGHRYGNITTGAIISREKFRYGYLETRCKAAKGPVSSSFWTTGERGELDVFEHWGKDTKAKGTTNRYHTSFHDWRDNKSPTWGKRIWTSEHRLDFHVGEEFHVYGLEWAEDYIRIYIDGGLVRTVTRKEVGDAWVVDGPQKVWFDSEIFPWQVKPSSLTSNDFPVNGLVFEVDYVRIWQREGHSDLTESRRNLLTNGSFESDLSGWTPKGRPNAKSAPKATAETTTARDGNNAAFLQTYCVLEQTVRLKPNTTYILSGWLSLPGTRNGTVNHAAFGVKDYGGPEIRAKSTAQKFTRHSLQFTTSSSNSSATVFFTNDQKSQPAYGDMFELYELKAEGTNR